MIKKTLKEEAKLNTEILEKLTLKSD